MGANLSHSEIWKSKTFQQILQAVGFSTLRLHLTRLERQGMTVEAKNPKNGLEGRFLCTP